MTTRNNNKQQNRRGVPTARSRNRNKRAREAQLSAIPVPYLGSLAPDCMRVKLRYKDELFPTTTSGSVYSYVYRGNDIYDPDLTGTGHQPMGYDQWAALYSQWQVMSSTATVRGTDTNSTAAASTLIASLVPTVSSNDITAYQPTSCGELPYGKARLFFTNSANQADNVIHSHAITSKITGSPAAAIGGMPDWSGTTAGAAPSRGFYWHINAQDVGESTSLASVQFFVTIEYEVFFWARGSPAES